VNERQKNESKTWFVTKLVLAFPFVVFREQIEAALAILLVVASLAIAIGSWHYFPNHWYWIAAPVIALLAIVSWPVLKFADGVEERFNKRTPRPLKTETKPNRRDKPAG
jgi:CHASE2 domain-containing sensor protein